MNKSDMNNFDEETRKSKSQRKREVESLQDLGKALVALPPALLRKLPIEELVLNAILDAKEFKNEALRRQLQYIGKLMRKIDAAPIQEALDKINEGHRANNKRFHEQERWRDRLLSEGEETLLVFLSRYPHADATQLRQLIVDGKRSENNIAAKRQLFRFIKEVDEKTLS